MGAHAGRRECAHGGFGAAADGASGSAAAAPPSPLLPPRTAACLPAVAAVSVWRGDEGGDDHAALGRDAVLALAHLRLSPPEKRASAGGQ